MAKFDDLFADVKVQLHNCPNDVIRHQLYNAFRDFLKESQQWEEESDAYDIERGEANYNLNFNNQEFYVSSISGIKINNLIIEHRSKDWLDNELSDKWDTKIGDDFEYFYMGNRNTIRLYPIPISTQQEALFGKLIIYPQESAVRTVDIPDEIIAEWGETIGYGALWRLYKMSGKDWSNEAQAQTHLELFTEKTQEAKREKKSGFELDNNSTMRVKAYP